MPRSLPKAGLRSGLRAERGGAGVELVELEPACERRRAIALEEAVGLLLVERRAVTGGLAPGAAHLAAGEGGQLADRAEARGSVRVVPVGAVREGERDRDAGAGAAGGLAAGGFVRATATPRPQGENGQRRRERGAATHLRTAYEPGF